jgi:hypothetical protein
MLTLAEHGMMVASEQNSGLFDPNPVMPPMLEMEI